MFISGSIHKIFCAQTDEQEDRHTKPETSSTAYGSVDDKKEVKAVSNMKKFELYFGLEL